MAQDGGCALMLEGMRAYVAGALSSTEEAALLDHVLRCPSCHLLHWQPYAQRSTEQTWAFLDALVEDTLVADTADEPQTRDRGWLPRADGGQTDDGRQPRGMDPSAESRPKLDARLAQAPWDVSTLGLGDNACVSLYEVGAVLPMVPKPTLVQGYTTYLSAGMLSLRARGGGLRLSVDVGAEGVGVEALEAGLMVDGATLQPGELRRLRWSHLIQGQGWSCVLGVTSAAELLASHGVATLRYPGPRHAVQEQLTRFGRARGVVDVPLRDEDAPHHIRYRQGALEALEPARRGRMAQLTLDSYQVSKQHATLVRRSGRIHLRAEREFPVFCMRGDAILQTVRGQAPIPLLEGDTLRVGNALFELRV